MKAKIFDKTGKELSSTDLPKNFSSEIRKDIVQKVFEAQKREQTYGVMPGAGAGYSASGISRKKRHAWKVTYGKGISRVPRKIMSRHGSSFNWVGATTTNARGGRTSHPPRSEKNQFRKINKKELLMAINSCLAASSNSKLVSCNYNKEIKTLPVVFKPEVLTLKTKEFFLLIKNIYGDLFEKLIQTKTKRAGKGKMRGRKYKKNAGLLLVIGNKEKTKRKGIQVVKVDDLDIAKLSLNGIPGKVIAYTENSLKEITEKWKK